MPLARRVDRCCVCKKAGIGLEEVNKEVLFHLEYLPDSICSTHRQENDAIHLVRPRFLGAPKIGDTRPR